LPVIVALASGLGENPLTIAIPAALVASCAFMFPIATPPNAIVFGSGLLNIAQMAKTGLLLNFLSLFLINLVCWFLLPLVFGLEHGVAAEWMPSLENMLEVPAH
jgi:sodium-dependent dicarboxylate transporter 2/3/5